MFQRVRTLGDIRRDCRRLTKCRTRPGRKTNILCKRLASLSSVASCSTEMSASANFCAGTPILRSNCSSLVWLKSLEICRQIWRTRSFLTVFILALGKLVLAVQSDLPNTITRTGSWNNQMIQNMALRKRLAHRSQPLAAIMAGGLCSAKLLSFVCGGLMF